MNIDRRTYLGLSTAALVSITFPHLVLGQTENHTYQTDAGPISVHPVSHASFVLQTSSGVVYVDPVGGVELYRAYPSPDMVLVTHEHADHYDAETLISIFRGDRDRH